MIISEREKMQSFIAMIEAEGHGDYTQSVVRYRALQDAVNRYCDPETFRNVMDCYERILRSKFE